VTDPAVTDPLINRSVTIVEASVVVVEVLPVVVVINSMAEDPAQAVIDPLADKSRATAGDPVVALLARVLPDSSLEAELLEDVVAVARAGKLAAEVETYPLEFALVSGSLS